MAMKVKTDFVWSGVSFTEATLLFARSDTAEKWGLGKFGAKGFGGAWTVTPDVLGTLKDLGFEVVVHEMVKH
jgi:hypothetical protein